MATITEEQSGLNVPQFLDLIAWSEGTSTLSDTKNNGYDVIVTGVSGPEIFTNYFNHPFSPSKEWPNGRPAKLVRASQGTSLGIYSTASGRYQLLYRYYTFYKNKLNLPDFSPLSQDSIAIQQIKEKSVFNLITGGKIQQAIEGCSSIWASIPGNSYGQGGKSMEKLLNQWVTLGGNL